MGAMSNYLTAVLSTTCIIKHAVSVSFRDNHQWLAKLPKKAASNVAGVSRCQPLRHEPALFSRKVQPKKARPRIEAKFVEPQFSNCLGHRRR